MDTRARSRCASRSWAPTGQLLAPAGTAETLEVDNGAIELPPIVALPDSQHRFAPGAGPAADEADGVEWTIGHDVLARETTVATRYGATYQGLHGATVTDDYRGALGVSVANPARAWARGRSTYTIDWPEGRARTGRHSGAVGRGCVDVAIRLRAWDGDDEIADAVADVPR
jgi:hypothetical protein